MRVLPTNPNLQLGPLGNNGKNDVTVPSPTEADIASLFANVDPEAFLDFLEDGDDIEDNPLADFLMPPFQYPYYMGYGAYPDPSNPNALPAADNSDMAVDLPKNVSTSPNPGVTDATDADSAEGLTVGKTHTVDESTMRNILDLRKTPLKAGQSVSLVNMKGRVDSLSSQIPSKKAAATPTNGFSLFNPQSRSTLPQRAGKNSSRKQPAPTRRHNGTGEKNIETLVSSLHQTPAADQSSVNSDGQLSVLIPPNRRSVPGKQRPILMETDDMSVVSPASSMSPAARLSPPSSPNPTANHFTASESAVFSPYSVDSSLSPVGAVYTIAGQSSSESTRRARGPSAKKKQQSEAIQRKLAEDLKASKGIPITDPKIESAITKPIRHRSDVNTDSVAERNVKNAINARLNRQRKKEYLESLEEQNTKLVRDNTALLTENKSLKSDKQSLMQEVQYLRNVLENQSALANVLKNLSGVEHVRLSSKYSKGDRKRVANMEEVGTGASPPKVRPGKSVPDMTGGVCLHVDKDQVSIEMCSKCAEMAATD